jgi:hypothetical protein
LREDDEDGGMDFLSNDEDVCEYKLPRDDGAFGYVSAAVPKPTTSFTGAIKSAFSSVSRTVSACTQNLRRGSVPLHPDAPSAAPLQQKEHRIVRKALAAKSAFTTMHLLGLMTVVAHPVSRAVFGKRPVVAVHTRSCGKSGKQASASGGDILSSEEDDEGI